MKNLITIIAVVLTITLTSFADIIPIPSEGGGGGSGTIASAPSSISQSIKLNGLNAGLNAENQPAETQTWTNEDTGEIYYYEYPKRSYGNAWFNLDQGFMGKSFVPVNAYTSLQRWDNEGNFSINSNFFVMITEEEMSWIEPGQTSISWDLFGVSYNIGISLRHDEEYVGHGDYIQTNDLVGDMNFRFDNSETTWGHLNIESTDWWYNGGLHDAIAIRAYFDLHFTGSPEQLETLNARIPLTAIPEPATLTILTLGGLLLKRKK